MLFTISLMIHVIFVVLWMGGVGFVTIVLFPMIARTHQPLEKVLLFQRIEHRYAKLARLYAIIVGATGFVNLYYMGGLKLLFTGYGWGITVMFLVWIMWMVLLFGLEPIVIRRILKEAQIGNMDIDTIFKRMNIFHWVLLSLSLLAIIGGISFGH